MKQQPTKTATKGARPTHTMWVVKGEGKAADYHFLASAWAHKDGQGFSGESMLGRIVIRPRKEEQPEEGAQQ